MFSRPPHPFSGGFPPRFPRHGFTLGQRGLFPGQRPIPSPGIRGQPGMRGGFLAKLFGMGGRPAGMGHSPFGPAVTGAAQRSGGFLQALSNPASIGNFLSNTQKVLNTASQIGPLVQQYGPLVRNLPAMWKIYKGLKDAGSSGDTGQESAHKSSSAQEIKHEETPEEQKKTKTGKAKRKQTSAAKPADSQKGKSVPKLYI